MRACGINGDFEMEHVRGIVRLQSRRDDKMSKCAVDLSAEQARELAMRLLGAAQDCDGEHLVLSTGISRARVAVK